MSEALARPEPDDLSERITIDPRGARPGQLGAHDVVMQALRSFRDGRRPRPECSVILPPGYGKTHLIRWIAASVWGSGLAACTLVLSPADYLRGQIVDADKMGNFLGRFRVRTAPGLALKYDAISSPGVAYAANGEFLLSTTMQLAQRTATFAKWIASVKHRTGQPVLVVVDEVHMNSTIKEWGRAVRRLQEAGAFVVVLTGTGYRDDNEPIVGFEAVEIATETLQWVKVRPHDVPEKVWLEYWSGRKTYYDLAADFAYGCRDAWAENAMCHVTHHKLDVDVDEIHSGRYERVKLSQMSIAASRRVLGKVVRDPKVIAEAAEMAVRWLHKTRANHPGAREAALLVFCANDDDDESNEHPEAVRRAILKIDPTLKVVIATSAAEGQPGKKVLEDFALHGIGDVLIVKQMAGLGMDAERVKVVLDLSPVRSVGPTIQRICRGTRPWQGLYFSHWITLADALSTINFDLYVRDEDGATATTEWELEREDEAPRRDPEPSPVYEVGRPYLTDLEDTKNNHAGWAGLERLVRILDVLPSLIGSHTIPELLLLLPRLEAIFGVAPQDAEPVAVNTGDETERLREQINGHARTLAHLRFQRQQGRGYGKGDSAVFGPVIQQVFVDAYARASLERGTRLEQLRDHAALRAVDAALTALMGEETA